MGNSPKAKQQHNQVIVTPEVKALAREMGMGPGTTMSAEGVNLMQRAAELDLRRQAQIQNQIKAINRLISLLFDPTVTGDLEDDAVAKEMVFHTPPGSAVWTVIGAEVHSDNKVYVALKRTGEVWREDHC